MKRNVVRIQRVAAWLAVVCLGLLLSPLSARGPKPKATLKGQTAGVMFLAYSPDGKTLASGGMDKPIVPSGTFDSTIKLWDVKTGKVRATLKGAFTMAFSPDGETLASGTEDKQPIKLWDVKTGKVRTTLKGVRFMAYSKDGKTLASDSTDKTIKLWDVKTGKVRTTLKGHTAPESLTAMAYSPDGKTLASVNEGKTIKLWDVQTGKEQTTLKGHMKDVLGVKYSPDGKTLASLSLGDEVKEIKLWDVKTGKVRSTLEGDMSAFSVAFSPDGKTLASGGIRAGSGERDEGFVVAEISLWDVKTGKVQTTLTSHTEAVFSVAFSPDGKTLASGSGDGTIELWDIPAVKKADKSDK